MRTDHANVVRGIEPIFVIVALVLAPLLGLLGGCANPSGQSVDEQRAAILSMRDRTVADIAAQRPGFLARLDQAPGYGVFSNVTTKLLFIGAGSGYGVVVNNRSGERTFMRMNEIGAGLGVGVKDWRAVMVFNDPKAMYMFLQDGWDLGGDADAAFRVGDKGGQVSTGFVENDVDVYQFTEQGVTLGAMLNGVRFYPDPKLNAPGSSLAREPDAARARRAATAGVDPAPR